MKKIYLVSATHVSPEYTFDKTEVRVGHYEREDLYWADHPKLGCGKDFKTPEAAIRYLFQDHACQVTKIEEAPHHESSKLKGEQPKRRTR